MAQRRRLDAEMVRRELVESRSIAQREITAGRVTVGGAPALKPSRLVDPAEDVQILGPPPQFVSRAGAKLEGALEAFDIDLTGTRCLDAGSSTGGFTDCLLQRGAASVIAVDVGTHQLHERIRSDDRVDVRERTDVRSIEPADVGGFVDVVVGDLSFISLKLAMPALFRLSTSETEILLLIKPQFEAGRVEVSRGRGVITNPLIWQRVLTEIWQEATRLGGALIDVVGSSITGRSGNAEFVGRFRSGNIEPVAEHRLADVVREVAKDGML